MDRLATLKKRAAILGISISDIEGDADAIDARIAGYQSLSRFNHSKRGGFTKTCTAVEERKDAWILDK